MKLVASLDDIDNIISNLKKIINSRDVVVLLQGTLASGKTTLVKNYVKSIGLSDTVTSPTFSLQTKYGENIYHYDVYNKTLEQFISLGLLEEFENSGVHFVEWGSDDLKTILEDYGFRVIVVKIEKKEDKREYIIES